MYPSNSDFFSELYEIFPYLEMAIKEFLRGFLQDKPSWFEILGCTGFHERLELKDRDSFST